MMWVNNKQRRSYVYFILARDVSAVKIGIASRPLERLSTLQTASPVKLELIGFCRGNHKDERDIHVLLEPLRLHGEWFALCGWLRRFIASEIGCAASEDLYCVEDHESIRGTRHEEVTDAA